ncbi:MAG TPA: lasso peptide biosynthesis B2 protein [Steroidobacteraceae bacterium]|nr:lasso peptide biosynthesis B2 protein [Steroidobacteraceae bacterium]
MGRYALANHVFVCLNGDQIVFLDLKEDRYWALEASQTAGLAACVSGWPVQDDPDRPSSADTVADALVGRGLLSDGSRDGKDATPVVATAPSVDLIVDDGHAVGPAGWISLAKFLTAAVTARIVLWCLPFERVVRRVTRRKKISGPKAPPLDIVRARRIVEAFGRHRVFFFTSHEECLYDSLALLEFLALHRLYPDWVFGVRTRPFAAHCWVQQDAVVFNDTVDHATSFSPIMVA